MINRNRLVLAGFCCFFAAATRLPAQGNTAEIFGGYQYTKANPEAPLPKQSMNGWMGGASGYLTKMIGVSAEVSAGFGSAPAPSSIGGTAFNFKEYTYMAGPMFRFVDTKKLQTSVKWLLGGSFGQANIPTSTSPANVLALAQAGYSGFNQTKFAMLVAVPVDLSVSKLIAFRVEPGLYMTDFNKTKQSNFRISFGPVFRFGGK
ncbi:MAG TPA: hypothetical protein VG456_07820 [Candidatus Sulfopaludibacter sp.]|jgi:hypothetical protein|nr:hypothetical protein [Candidatus Sulfopaludibacter sp.]